MKALVQRVKRASVTIGGDLHSEINSGMLVFIGVEKGDTKDNAIKLANKLVNLRIFEDDAGKMNLSLIDVQGEIMIVSQFTLCGNCTKGTRPSFDKSAPLNMAMELYEYFVEIVRGYGLKTATGKFQSTMDVDLINDGPVTFFIEK